MSFLNAAWKKLVIANYTVDPEILLDYVPHGTELDSWNGACYVSLVGFMFVNTRVLGLPIPYHRDFEEVNLRFYVKRKENGEWKRGVVFIKELVPRSAITFIANTIYKEHYQTVPMRHEWQTKTDTQLVKYAWKLDGIMHSMQVHAHIDPVAIVEGSQEEFITEHYWGYTKVGPTKTYAYEVKHPKWDCYHVKDYAIAVNYGAVYGENFEFLNSRKPASVMLAEGTEIAVENRIAL
jgi:uncharacterized protein YqjF (DUF2071 family)